MRNRLFPLIFGLVFATVQPARAQVIIQKILEDNPIGFWILDDASTTAMDSSATGLNGTYETGVTPRGIAGPSWVPASGRVADFNGGNITFPIPLDLGASGSGYSIEAWIKPTVESLQKTTRIVASGRGTGGYGFGTAAGGQLVFTSFSVNDYFTTELIPLLPTQWYYVGVVLEANNDAKFYVNGSLAQTVRGLFGAKTATQDFTIGSRSPPAADEFYTGGLAGISVYNYPLTSGQILVQFNAAAVPEPPSLLVSGLVALGAGCILRQRRRKASNSVPR